jgi:hypothetical protein
MATHTMHGLVLSTRNVNEAGRADPGLASRISTWFSQALCGLQGHDELMQFRRDRMYLLCTSCGHQSPGWTLVKATPRRVLRGDPRRHMMTRPEIVTHRRIA